MNVDRSLISRRNAPVLAACHPLETGHGNLRKWSLAFIVSLLTISLVSCVGISSRNDLSVYLDVSLDHEGHWLTVKFQNIGKSDLEIWESGFWPNTLLTCHDEAGISPPTTVEGQRLLNAFNPGGSRDKNVSIRLKPFQVHNGDPVLLERVFVMDPAKTYFVSAVYEERAESGWGGRVGTNPVRIMPWKTGGKDRSDNHTKLIVKPG